MQDLEDAGLEQDEPSRGSKNYWTATYLNSRTQTVKVVVTMSAIQANMQGSVYTGWLDKIDQT